MFDIVSIVKIGGYLGLFLIIFSESGLFFGFFLPGDSLLFTAGFLSSQGYFSIVPLTILLFIAAISGDSVGYMFGKKFGPKVFSRPKSFFFHPTHVEKTSRFFERYGAKTILIARFIPIVRTFAPIMAGVGEMKYRTFIQYNALGALLWAVGLTLLGYIFGQRVPNAEQYVVPIIVLIVLTSFVPPVLEYLKEKGRSNISDNQGL